LCLRASAGPVASKTRTRPNRQQVCTRPFACARLGSVRVSRAQSTCALSAALCAARCALDVAGHGCLPFWIAASHARVRPASARTCVRERARPWRGAPCQRRSLCTHGGVSPVAAEWAQARTGALACALVQKRFRTRERVIPSRGRVGASANWRPGACACAKAFPHTRACPRMRRAHTRICVSRIPTHIYALCTPPHTHAR